MTSIPKFILVNAFVKTMKENDAQHLVDEAVVEIGLRHSDDYTDAEVHKIIKHLQTKGGIIKILALGVETRLILSGELKKE